MPEADQQPPIYQELAELEAVATSAEDHEQIKAWRREVDEKRAATLGHAALPELTVDHAGVVMTAKDRAEAARNGTDQELTRHR
jgi:hypothetical protein